MLSKLCAWDLLNVIANIKTIGNYFLYKMNGNDDDSHLFNVTRGIKTLFLTPVHIHASLYRPPLLQGTPTAHRNAGRSEFITRRQERQQQKLYAPQPDGICNKPCFLYTKELLI